MIATSDVFSLSREEIIVAALLASLPVATNIFVLAIRYEARPGRVSGSIFLSTLLALVSFNGWAWLLLAT